MQVLNLAKWLERLTDYVHITGIRPVPMDKVTGFSHYYRVIPKMSLDERIVHQAARHDVSVDAAREHLKGYQTQATIEPYIRLPSQSTGHNFTLHIGKQSANGLGDGKFGTYGLSRSAGVRVWVMDDVLAEIFSLITSATTLLPHHLAVPPHALG